MNVTNPAIKGINGLIGGGWAFIGFLLFSGSLLWVVALLFADTSRSLLGGIPLPESTEDFILIAGLIFMGGFCMAWGGAMLGQQEWGAFAGGVIRLILTLFLLTIAALFNYYGAAYWIKSAATLSFYNKYVWLIWSLFGLGIIWLMVTTWLLLFDRGRRDYYAQSYYNTPKPSPATCDKCGLILDEGRCPKCDRLKRMAWLKIGSRREELLFTEDRPALVIGRQKDKNEAHITLSKADTAHPERVSGRHVRLRYYFEGEQFTIEDLASMNKTYLNGEMLPPNKPSQLYHEDKIDLAHEIELIFDSKN